jgi:hypothetical protein
MASDSMEVPLSIADVVIGILLPGVIALVIFLIGRALKNACWTTPLASAIALVIAFFQLDHQLPNFPPAESLDRLFWIIPGVLVIALILNLRKLSIASAGLIVLLASGAAVGYVLAFKFRTLSPVESGMWLLICAIAALAWWFAMVDYERRSPRIAPSLALGILTGVAALLFMLCDTISNGRLELSLVAVIGAAFLASIFLKDFTFSRGGLFSVLLFTLLLIAHTFVTAGLKPVDLALLLSSPVVLWLASLIPLKRAWQRVLIQLIILCIPLTTATIRAVVVFNQQNQTTSQSDEDL